MKRKEFYRFPDCRRVRVILDTDAACECDDQYAIVHALLSPKADVRAITAAHYGKLEADSMENSYAEVKKVLQIMSREDVPVYKGSYRAMKSESEIIENDGSRVIEEEALAEDERPLFILCQGAITNLACALIKNPQIADRLTVIWIGGANYPYGGYEFNVTNDVNAANVVLKSGAPIWMVPQEVYSTLQTGMEELYLRVHSCGKIGEYLYDNTVRVNQRMSNFLHQAMPQKKPEDYLLFPNGGSWALGDSCAIGLLLSANSGTYRMVPAPLIREDGTYDIPDTGREIRLYESVDRRFILEDFYSKLYLNAGGGNQI